MKNIFLIIIIASLISCNSSDKKSNRTKENINASKTIESKNVSKDNYEIQFVNIESGLNEKQTIETSVTENINIDYTQLSKEAKKTTMYCLTWVKDEWGYYKGEKALFSIWKPKPNSGFGCCIWVNIQKNGRIVARKRVTVTNSKHIKILLGTVNGVSQSVSPC